MKLSDISQKLNIKESTIRDWDRKGLLKSTIYKNYRVFELKQISNLHQSINSNNAINRYKVLKSKRKTSYNVIELFAGAGGTALGFENAGLNHILLNEIDKQASKSLQFNLRNNNIICDDVSNLCFKSYKNVDIVQAGFPCQAFSYAGKSLGFKDIRGTLFFEFARCIKETRPKIAIGENVKGLLNHDTGKTLEVMINVLNEIGYKVQYKILKAQHFDVPQKRERLIIIAIRNDLNINFFFPKEKNYLISVGEALSGCPDSVGQMYPQRKKEILNLVPEGGCWKNLPIAIQKEYMKGSFFLGGGKTGMARRLSSKEPSLTLTCSPSQKQTERCHPFETRPLNVREYARIQTFPDTWQFCGSMSSQYKQIGNAVPVNLAYHIGCSIINALDNLN